MSEPTLPPEGGPQDIAHWQGEARKAFDARQAAKKEADELRKQLEAVKGINPEEYRTLKAQAEQLEQDRAKKAGEFDQLQQQMKARHQAELTAEQQKREAVESRWKQTVIGRAFAEAVDLFGPSGRTIYLAADAERIFGDRVTVLDDGRVAVLDAEGDVMKDKAGQPLSFAAAMAHHIDTLPDRQYRLRGSGKTGSGSSGGITGAERVINLDPSTLTPEQRRDPKVLAALKASLPRGGTVMGRAYDQ